MQRSKLYSSFKIGSAIQYSTVQYSTVQYSTVQGYYSTVQYRATMCSLNDIPGFLMLHTVNFLILNFCLLDHWPMHCGVYMKRRKVCTANLVEYWQGRVCKNWEVATFARNCSRTARCIFKAYSMCVLCMCMCVWEGGSEGVEGGGGKKKQTELRRQKVVAAVWGTEFIQFHAALQI